jgi:putative membrane protein
MNLMNRAVIIGAVILAVSGTAVYAQDPRQRAEKAHATSGQPGDDQHFVMEAANAGMAEVELGKLATTNAGTDEVKKFGQRMADDHTKASDELKTLAQSKNIMLPTIDSKHKATHDRLVKLSGAQFDQAYMRAMVADHRQAVALFRKESQAGKDSDVKAWASKTLPTLEDHLKQAQEANKAVGISGSAMTKKTPKN